MLDKEATNLFFADPDRVVPADLLFLGEEILNDPTTGQYVQNEIRRYQVYHPDRTAEQVWDLMISDGPESLQLGLRMLEEEESRPTDHTNLYTHKGLTVNVKDISQSDFTFLQLEVEDRAAFESLAYVRSMYINTAPNVKLCYPEPFLASPSFIHGDLGFLHILQYQFWLWFMFIFLVVFYFVTFLCVVRWCGNRNQPRRETRGVSRSKCGDLITATVPVTWAISIIVSESTDATDYYDGHGTGELIVGVRAYQWGWEYYYPKGIDLNYNFKANYTSYAGKSLRYNTAAEKSLTTLGIWKSYQQKDVDQVVTPAHLLVLPLDNSKLLNFMRFKTVGASVQRDSEAFKRVRSYSKVYSMNLVHTPSVFTEKYIKLNNFISTTNDVNSAATYGLQRQHNLTASAAANGTCSTFLDQPSLDRFLNYVRQYNVNKTKTQVQTVSPDMWLEADGDVSTTTSKVLMNNLLANDLSEERLFWRPHFASFELFHSYPTVLKRLGVLTEHTAPEGYGTNMTPDVASSRDYAYLPLEDVYRKQALKGNPLGSLLDPLTWVLNTGVNMDHIGNHSQFTRGGSSILPYANYNLMNSGQSNLTLVTSPKSVQPLESTFRSPRNYYRFDTSSGDPVLSRGVNSLDANLTSFAQNQVANSPISYLQLRATRWDDLGRWNALASNRLRAQAGYAPVAGNFAEYQPVETDALNVTPVDGANMVYDASEGITSDARAPSLGGVTSLQPHLKLKSVDSFETKVQKDLKAGVASSKKMKKLVFAQDELVFWLSPEQQKPVIAAQDALTYAINEQKAVEKAIVDSNATIKKSEAIIASVEVGTRYEKAATKALEDAEATLVIKTEELPLRQEDVVAAKQPVAHYVKVDAGYRGRLQVQEVNHLYRGRLRNMRLRAHHLTNNNVNATNVLGSVASNDSYPRITESASASKLQDNVHKALVTKRLPSPYFAESSQAPELPEHIRWDRSSTIYAHVNPDLLLNDLTRYVRGESLTSAFLETDCSDYNYKDPLIMARWESRAQKLLLAKNRQRTLLALYRSQLRPIQKTFNLTPESNYGNIVKKHQFPGFDDVFFNKTKTRREGWSRNFFWARYLNVGHLLAKDHHEIAMLKLDEDERTEYVDPLLTTAYPFNDSYEYVLGRYQSYEELGTNEDIASFTEAQLNNYLELEDENSTKGSTNALFYPSSERALMQAEQECWANKKDQISAAAYAMEGEGENEEDQLEPTDEAVNWDTHPRAYETYLIDRVIEYRTRVVNDFEAHKINHEQAFKDSLTTSFRKRSYLQRPETSLSVLAADFDNSIPAHFLSRQLTGTDINHLTERDLRGIKAYLNPVTTNPELYEEVLFNEPYRRGQWMSERFTSLFNPVLSHYHEAEGLSLSPWWTSLQPRWQEKVHYYLDVLGRRDLHLAHVGDYYSHTLEADNFTTPAPVMLSKDKSLIPLTGKRSRKSSSMRQYNTVRELFAVNSTFTVPFTTPFTYPQSYVSAFSKSDLLSMPAKWDFESNSKQGVTDALSGGGIEYQTFLAPTDLSSPNVTRQLNPVVVRTVAKNARAGYNALRKVVKLRFEEGRAHTHTYHAANVGVERPFATNTPVVATKLLGKNKESFYSSTFYANKPFEVFNDFSNSANSLNSYFFDFPFLVSQLSTPSRFMWFDWYTRWSRLDIQPASDASKATLIGSQRVAKLYQLPNEEAQDLGDHESYLIRNQRYRRNHLPIWLFNLSSYNKAAVWTQKDWVEVLPQKGTNRIDWSKEPSEIKRLEALKKLNAAKKFNAATKLEELKQANKGKKSTSLKKTTGAKHFKKGLAARHLKSVWRYLTTAEYYWTRSMVSPASSSTQFTGSFSNSYKSSWRPYSSVQSYHYNVTTLVDLLTRRELLYRQYLERTNRIIRLPRMLTVNPHNPLIAEVKASFKLIDPITYSSEYSREHYYYSLRYFKFLMFKGWIASLGVSLKDLPINPKLVNEYLFFYFLSKRQSPTLGNNANLYKSQFRPLKKGITNMIRLHGTGAVAMPIEIRLQILASSRDVIHSWAIPSAGIKIDCIPGYTSHRILIFLTPGIYWGQCMEICGRYHHWMPIIVYFMKRDLFFLWCTHFGSRKDQKLLWDTDDRQFSDYLKFVSYDRASWLTELSKRM